MYPAWQAFEREGKGSLRRERNARGALSLPFRTPATQASITVAKAIFVIVSTWQGNSEVSVIYQLTFWHSYPKQHYNSRSAIEQTQGTTRDKYYAGLQEEHSG